ncbi:MAG: UvrD-helicase domain-containing protein [Bifidobacteriaceae bacterium]|jgi:DNA helicase-2/ATP-dependent DNA helicase PcrA|nr:UvrD-helicase domain-containing protein [Bifidobacteriaceae bacterium]MCI1979246.1 UvrD-helicase domain-containing protein [Bifidobacteriaceae bacterium]
MSAQIHKISQTPEQRAVVSADPGSDVLVVAGAGSGKTYTMTQRIIELITKHGIRPDSILGLTFTNKAAKELQTRVISAVTQHVRADAPSGSASVEALTSHPTVLTYDAFFQQIVRQYGLLIGVEQSVMPLSDAGRYELASGVVSESMAELFEGADGDLSAANAENGDSEDASAPENDPSEGEAPVSRFDALVSGVLEISDECLNYMIDEDHLSFGSAVERAEEWNDEFILRVSDLIDKELADNPEAAEALEEEPKITSSLRGKKNKEKIFAEYSEKLHLRSLHRAKVLLDTAKQRRVLLRLARKYDERKRANGFAEFSDFTVYALQLLERFPSIGQEYRRRFTHVFLDEYQDTSTTQSKLIAKLFHPRRGGDAAGVRRSSGEREVRSAVTAVGDPFQSIYAWRGASPGAFALFRGDFGLDSTEPNTLSASVRNPKLVLDAANAMTTPLRQHDLLSRKGAVTSSRVREVEVKTLSVLPREGQSVRNGSLAVTGYSSRHQEAEAVANFAAYYSAKYKDDAETPVAILVRSKARMAEYRAALEEKHLRYEVVGFSDLMQQPEVQDLFALLEAVTDHTASDSILRLLGSPRFSVPGDQLRLLADMANDANTQLQYAALRAAGYGTGREDLAQKRALVRQYRDVVPNLTTLVEVILDESVSERMRSYGDGASRRFSAFTLRSVTRLSHILRRVEAVKNAGVSAALHEAVEALDLDIDLVVSAALDSPDSVCVTRSEVGSHLEVIFQMVDTYSSELPAGLSPTLGGFVQWVQTFEKDPPEPVVSHDRRADVILMTIHQSKGLGFRAVAVPEMQERVFPSANSLTVRGEEPEEGSSDRQHLHFTVTAKSWIESPSAVPAPMRTDARILPRFPHGAIPDKPVESLYFIKSVDTLDAEVFGADEDNAKIGQTFDFLSLREEYGSRAHADERRLAYVALTRSKDAVMLSFNAHEKQDKTSKDGSQVLRTDITPSKAGIFWKDAADFVSQRSASAASEGGQDDAEQFSSRGMEPGFDVHGAEGVERQCIGSFLGDDADELKRLVMDSVELVTNDDLDRESATGVSTETAWPLALKSDRYQALVRSARAVENAALEDPLEEGASGAKIPTQFAGEEGSLLNRAHQVMAQRSLNISSFEERASADASVTSTGATAEKTEGIQGLRQRAQRVLPGLSLGVTRLQHFAAAQGEEEEQQLLGILRPVPQPPNFAASLGTRFHAWAQEFFDEDTAEPPVDSGEGTEGSRLQRWQRNLMGSRWADRNVEALEREYVIEVFGLRVVAKIDAIFRGSFDGTDIADENGRYFTIVDWKTGRKPTAARDVLNAQLQLELYRIAFMRNEQVPLDHIEACLYYVDRTQESDRIIRADDLRTEEEILTAVRGESELLTALEEGKDVGED